MFLACVKYLRCWEDIVVNSYFSLFHLCKGKTSMGQTKMGNGKSCMGRREYHYKIAAINKIVVSLENIRVK